MKQILLVWAAAISAVCFSASNKPFATLNFKLLADPTSSNIVKNPAQWSPSGTTYGDCTTASDKIACTISLNSTRSTYFHNDGAKNILNTYDYANGTTPKQDYLVITETSSSGNGGNDRIIVSISPYRWDATANGPTGAYVTTSLGADLSFFNGFEAP